MASVKVTLDTRKFDRAFREYMSGSKRDARTVMMQQAKGVVRYAIDLTPPGHVDRGEADPKKRLRKGAVAKKMGEENVFAQIFTIMYPTKRKKGANPATIHARFRNRGRVVARKSLGNNRWRVPYGELKAFIKRKQAMVGYLASGWKAAADKFGINLPKWIARHSAPGLASFKVTGRSITVKMTNSASYSGSMRQLRKLLQIAVNMQANAIERQLRKHSEKRAKQAGFKVE